MRNSGLTIRNSFLHWGAFKHLWEVILIPLVAYFFYMLVRKYLIPDIQSSAIENAVKVISFESAGGFLWELAWQSWAIESSSALITFFNWVYIITFWPIILATGVTIYILDRPRFVHYRNVLLGSLVFGLILFALFPLAPPRFLPEYGFIDAIQQFGPTWYGGRDMAVYYNAYAAMPSMHFGWTVLLGILFLRTKNVWVKPFGIIYPTMTFFAITLTGNHYIIDAVGGAAVITASYFMYVVLLRWKLRFPPLVAVAKSSLSRALVYSRETFLLWKARIASFQTAMTSRLRLEHPLRTWKKGGPIRMSFAKAKRT